MNDIRSLDAGGVPRAEIGRPRGGVPEEAQAQLPRRRGVARPTRPAPAARRHHAFRTARPNELWVTDLTEFRLPGDAGKVYLNAVVDCHDGRPAGWAVGTSPDSALANESLERACAGLSPGERPVIHSGRGWHYRWPGWVSICERAGLVRSMSRKGMSCDNARAEGLFGLLKQEFFYASDWSGVTAEGSMDALDAWLAWFRAGRISEALGWMTPNEYRLSRGYAL